MPNYNILRTRKIKTRLKITQAAEHNFRLRYQANIDKNRAHLNRVLVNTLDADAKHASSLQNQLTEYYNNLGIKEKEGNVLMMEFIVSASPDFFKDKPETMINDWANHQVEFMKTEFGDQLKLAILHRDERTPHIHFKVSTEIKSIKKYRNQKGEFHKETWSLNSKRYNPDFLRKLHDRHAESNKKFGLIRGIRGSKKKNHAPKEFYKMIDEALSTNYNQTIEKAINSLEKSWLGKVSVDEIREKFKPTINKLLKSNGALRKKFLFDIKQWAENLHKQRKEQEARQLAIDKQEHDLSARRELYAEAINSKCTDLTLIQAYEKKIDLLSLENMQLKAKFEALEPSSTLETTPGSTNSPKSLKTSKI
ncbi:recombinase [Burkholderia vietnamiensis]|uniref:plasmid recombination protein n=1 Tax=Burkholderia vietnamiensis TaxID=60552 RepID=UPI000752A962|nr:plasmid recombination protein [Burkholderia vietnamiensis]KVR74298.1 recombinase [Burkholderia vietnamiensis]